MESDDRAREGGSVAKDIRRLRRENLEVVALKIQPTSIEEAINKSYFLECITDKVIPKEFLPEVISLLLPKSATVAEVDELLSELRQHCQISSSMVPLQARPKRYR